MAFGDYVLLFIVLVILFIYLEVRKRKKVRRKKKKKLREQYKDGTYYLCDGIETPSAPGLSLYGDAHGGVIRPGMKILIPDCGEFVLKEVYANDSDPGKPNSEIPSGMVDTALFIETDNASIKRMIESLDRHLSRDKALALKIRD